MFNNISGIISKFTQPQRLIALLLVLLSIVVITLGPSLIDNNTKDCGDLEVIVNSQKERIIKNNDEIGVLMGKVSDLQRQVINNQQECTDNIVNREKEIYNQIEQLKRQMRGLKSNQIILDTVSIEMSQPMIIDNVDVMMDGLNKIQRGIQQDINNKRN
jgi:TolA-binding protein